MSPHTAWLILQGIETLPLRMARHMSNTQKVVEFLAGQPLSAAWATRCWRATPAMRWRKAAAARRGLGVQLRPQGQSRTGQEVHRNAQSLQPPGQRGRLPLAGDPPASTTHFRMSDEALAGAGISQGTIRLSIGLEDADDLIDDLKRALKAAEKAGA
jgi:O-acetylhomoserine (thiol)-lyase